MKRLGFFLSLLLLFAILFSVASAGWYNPAWRFRREITISNLDNDSTLVDYPIRIEVNANKSFKSDFSDLRFTTDDGIVSLEYWIEDYYPGLWATAWVKIPSIPAHGISRIYLYYGNMNAEDQSDGASTFYFFDDFDDCDISDWNIISGTWHANSAFLEQTEYAIRRKILSSYTITKPIIVKAELNHITGDPVCGVHIMFSKTSDCNNGYYFGYAGINRGGTMISRIIDGDVVQLVTDSTIQNSMYPNEWLDITIRFKGNGIYDVFLEAPDGKKVFLELRDTVWQKPYTLGLWVGDNIGCDNLYVYKYTGNPPKISIGGDEKNPVFITSTGNTFNIAHFLGNSRRLYFLMPFPGSISICLYDISGRKVCQPLKDRYMTKGSCSVRLDHDLKPGIYFIRCKGDFGESEISETEKVIFLK